LRKLKKKDYQNYKLLISLGLNGEMIQETLIRLEYVLLDQKIKL
jgi:hypothetical protein